MNPEGFNKIPTLMFAAEIEREAIVRVMIDSGADFNPN